jgi:hypothetical protein
MAMPEFVTQNSVGPDCGLSSYVVFTYRKPAYNRYQVQ